MKYESSEHIMYNNINKQFIRANSMLFKELEQSVSQVNINKQKTKHMSKRFRF